MNWFAKALAVYSLAAFGFSGCKEIQQDNGDSRSSNTYAVVVGMEKSAFAGECPGAAYDAKRMYSLLSKYTANVRLFIDEDAKKESVKDAIRNGVKNGELFIFYYSGHGGSEAFPDTGIEEDDGMDEFLCLYDAFMRDNEIWDIISTSEGRIMLIVDACHSKTIMRNPICFDLERFQCASFRAISNENLGVNIECWSGCPDDAYSFGSANGGKMTNTILMYFDPAETYDSLWNKVENDKSLQRFEYVQRTKSGIGFTNVKVFK